MSEPSREITGKSVQEAIDRGLAELGLPRDAVKVEVVREASRGLLGLGGEEAIVRLTPIPLPTAAAASPTIQPLGASSDLIEGVGPVARDTLEQLLRRMGIRSKVEVHRDMASEDGKGLVLNIVGNDLGILIGRRGETLRDLEYVTRLLVAQKSGKPAKLVVDVEGYRTRRERVLNELAKRMAERVQSSRQPITLEAMPPNERRIVHLALRDHAGVTTQSIGEGDHRRVMILPK